MGCRAQKAWLLSVPYPLIPTAPVSVGVPSCVFSAQTVPWPREAGDGNGRGLNIGHPKRPSANPLNL